MENDLAEIKERQDLLEAHLGDTPPYIQDVGSLDSIMESLPTVDRNLRAHVERQGTGA